MRQKRVFREWQHPRDDKGRFSRSGGGSWAKRAAAGFAKAEEGRVTPPAVAGRPRIGRNAKAALVLNQHQPGAGDALSKKWTPPPKLPPGSALRSIRSVASSLSGGTREEVLHDGVWREASGYSDDGMGRRTLRLRMPGDTPDVLLPDTGQKLIVRLFRLKLKEPLEPHEAKLMAAWRADAARPTAGMRTPTRRDDNLARYGEEVAEAEATLKEVKRKARARMRKRYPSSDGYDKSTWDFEVERDSEVRYAENKVNWARQTLDHVGQPDRNPETEAYLQGPGLGVATFEGKLDRKRPLAVYGDLLNIEDDDQATFRHLRDLSLLPAELHLLVARSMSTQRAGYADSSSPRLRKAVGIFLGSRPVHELNHSADLEAENPRGWGDGHTFDEVDGVYRGTGTLIVGATSQSEGRGEHGQPALHEFGHALDHAVGQILKISGGGGNWVSASEEWRDLHRRVVAAAPDMSPYFKQDGDAGPQEMWAEAFGEWSRARAKARMSSTYSEGTPADRKAFLRKVAASALAREFRIPANDGVATTDALNDYFEALVAKLGVDL